MSLSVPQVECKKQPLGDFERLLAKVWQEGINWRPDVVVALAGRQR